MFQMTMKKAAVIREYGILTVATLLLVIGVYVFKFPNNFSFGGVTGIAVVLSKITALSASAYTFIINMALLAVGFIFLGTSFGIKTVYVSVLTSVGLSAMEKFFPMTGPLTDQPVLELIFAIFLPALSAAILFNVGASGGGVGLSAMEKFFPMTGPLTDQPVLELIFAIFLPALSAAILFNVGASGGGTDIVAMILRTYTPINIGTALFLVDLGITIAACFVFDVTTGLFSFTGLMAKSLVIDNVIESINRCKCFNVICNNPEPICNFIRDELKRSATVYRAEGAFTHTPRTVILTVMKRGQAVQLRNYVRQVEPTAFMMITNSSEIIGKGFRGFN